MISRDQILNAVDDANTQPKAGKPWLEIRGNEIYILSPLYRLYISKCNYVFLWSIDGFAVDKLHRATAVVLALCNGKRTVEEIVKMTRPLVKSNDDAKAIEIANDKVKFIIYTMRQTRKEYIKQHSRVRSKYPAAEALIAKEEYLKLFNGKKFKTVEYQAKAFLPKDASEMVISPPFNQHEAIPLILFWHFTSECSTDCRYCYLGRRRVMLLPKGRVLSLIEEAADLGVLIIRIVGGDFLMYPYLRDVLAALEKHSFLPSAISTKSYLSKEKAKVLAESAAVTSLQFSIDSTVDDVADYLVDEKSFCNRIFKSIENALEAGLCVETKTVVTPYNILTIPKLYRDLKKRGVNIIRLTTYGRSGFHHSDDLFNHVASFQWLEKQLKQLQEEFPDDLVHIQNGGPNIDPLSPEASQKAWLEKSPCSAGRTMMMICADGKVIPCEQMPETEEHICGDLSHESIKEVWDGSRLRDMTYGVPRVKFSGTACINCAKWEDCIRQKGNCIRDLVIHYGNMYQPAMNCPQSTLPFVRQR
jgi:radical SAM protein with 4Fe4S-binding SPASM domain